jgi:hypothetical protein
LLGKNKNNPRVIFTQAQNPEARRLVVLQSVMKAPDESPAIPDYTQRPEPEAMLDAIRG